MYHSGAHGHFLRYLLNIMSGINVKARNSKNYDLVEWATDPKFIATYNLHDLGKQDYVINIRVRQPSYLKFFTMNFIRTKDLHLDPESMTHNTFEKLQQHPNLKYFLPKLSLLCGQESGDVESKFLREWFRLCFFDNDCATIDLMLSTSVCDHAQYVVDFESFYDGSILDHCMKILQDLKIEPIHTQGIDQLLVTFKDSNPYFHVDKPIKEIFAAIKNHESQDLTDLNIIQQAWIDNYLVARYNIDPWMRNEYFTNTEELVNAYGL